jgi:hypothetical protein
MNPIYAALIPEFRCETRPRQLPTLEGLVAKIGLKMELGYIVCCLYVMDNWDDNSLVRRSLNRCFCGYCMSEQVNLWER